jgi:predicted Zn-dependent protease
MAQAVSPEAIEKATGKSWDDWLAFFESIDAASLSHADIARKTHEQGGATGWWSQMLTVAYEQHIGRRVPGQDCEGEFSVAVSKILNSDMDASLQWWQNAVGGQDTFADVAISRGPDVSETDKWRYWRAGLADGSRVNVNIYEKAAGKSILGIQHEKLESTEQVEHWRAFWKKLLAEASRKS